MQIFNEKQMATVGRVDMFYCGEDSTAHLPSNDGFIGRVTAFMSSTNETLLHWHHLDNGSCLTLLEIIYGTSAILLMHWETSTMDSCLRFLHDWYIKKKQGASLVIVNNPPTLSVISDRCRVRVNLVHYSLSSLQMSNWVLLEFRLCRKETKVHDNTKTYLINFISFHSFCSPLYPSNGQISELSK